MDQPASNAVLISEMSIWAQRTLGHLILAGVFERYPTLKFVPTELQTAWALNQAASLDMIVATSKKDAKNRTMPMFGGDVIESLTLSPTEYVKRNVYYGASVYGPGQQEERERLGVDHIMWGSDYPHEEGSTPESRAALRWAFADVPVDQCRLMMGGTAAKVYGFDLDALTPIAAEIGPTLEEIHSAPERTVNDDYMGRPFAGGSLLMRSRDADSRF